MTSPIQLQSCLSSFTAFRDCATTTLSQLKTLEKEPHLEEDVLLALYEQTQQAWTQFEENKTPSSLVNFLVTATFVKETTSDMKTTALGLISSIAKNSLKEVAEGFFTLCPLPFSMTAPSTTSFDFTAATAIAGFVGCESLLSTYMKDKEKQIDYVTRGTVIGTAMAWTFNQNLYLGALSGTLASLGTIVGTGLLTPWMPPFTSQITEAQNFVSNTLTKHKVKEIFSSFRWDLILPVAAFFTSASSIAQKYPTIDWPSALSISLIPAGATYSIFFSKAKATEKILSKAYQQLGPIIWTSYASMALSLAFQHTIAYLSKKP